MIGNMAPEDSWQLEKLGKFSASEIYKLLSQPKDKAARERGDMSDTANKYVHECVAEILTGTIRYMDSIFAIEWGNTHEPDAIERLKEEYPNIEYFGNANKRFFLLRRFAGGSPDAVDFPLKKVFEIKCPEDPENHVVNMLLRDEYDFKAVHNDYWCQLQMNMMCVAKQSGFEFMESQGLFVSYCPLMLEEGNKIKKITVSPDANFAQALNVALNKAENYLVECIEKLC